MAMWMGISYLTGVDTRVKGNKMARMNSFLTKLLEP